MTNESFVSNMEKMNETYRILQREEELSDCQALQKLVEIYGSGQAAQFLNWLGSQNDGLKER